MPESPPTHLRVPLPIAIAIATASFAAIAAADVLTSRRVNLTALYAFPITVAAAGLHRKLMWTFAVSSIAASLGLFALMPHLDMSSVEREGLFFNRIMSCIAMGLLAGVLHGLVGTYRKLERGREILSRRREELEAANAELAAREEEITTQNEELQSQTEELERQGEELRVTNEELARRERTLEVLLSLSRALTADLSRDEMMTRICRTLGQIIDHGTAAAILLREGGTLRLVCQEGFGDQGPLESEFPYAQSFAALVLERNRTGFLEDVSLRPDLRGPQPHGPRRFQSILATPLRVNNHAIGTLEAYNYDKQSWTDEQIAMIESLAAQTSISLQASELYERIEQERTRLAAVLQTVPFSVMISNADMSDIRLNPAGAVAHRVPPDVNLAMMRDPARWRLYHNGVLLGEDQHPLVRAVRYGEILNNREYELVLDGGPGAGGGAGGGRHTLLYSAAPIRDHHGKILGGVAAAADITEQKRLQFELDARRREAEEASARKTRFLAAVSHDIRTPANAISLLAELMQRTASTPALHGEIPQLAGDLRSNALSLVHLVSDVLDLTRFDSGRIELEESEFGLDAAIMDECRQLQPLAREKGLEFSCDPPPQFIRVRADRVKLTRILGNLISNALKFTAEGRVIVTAGASREQGAWIRVCDTGPGIPSEFQDRIFDEFFQLKQTAGSTGSGLGLAICRRLAHAMGGQITLRSEAGKGSCFTLTLPPSTLVPT
jgi:signal transduction histidine kinase